MRTLFLTLSTLVACIACSNNTILTSNDQKTITWNPMIETFKNCEEIQTYLESYKGPTAVAASDSLAQHYSSQVAGVDEGDILQSNEQYYFFARSGSIEVVDRKTLDSVASLPVPIRPRLSLVANGDSLIAVSGDSQNTWVQVFDMAHRFQTIWSRELIGEPLDFRVLGESLSLVSRSVALRPRTINDKLPCSQIYRPNVEDGQSGATHVYRLPLPHNHDESDQRDFDSMTLWGPADFFYMTKTELFLFQGLYQKNGPNTGLRIVDFSNSGLSFRQSEIVPGRLKDRSAIFLRDRDLFLATTELELTHDMNNINDDPPGTVTVNRILSYSKDPAGLYRSLSASPVMGRREDIRAVQYLGDKAYVVTFEKTDPLYVVSIADPANIQILSELKSPGFSTELTPLTDRLVLGMGFDTQSDIGFSWFAGVKASLFDLADPLTPLERSTLKFGDRGSYSESVFDFKGLTVSARKKAPADSQIIVPMVELALADGSRGPWSMGTKHQFSGAIHIQVREQRLIEVGRYTHAPWREAQCGRDAYNPLGWWSEPTPSLDIQRATFYRGCVDTFSRFGVRRYCTSSAGSGPGALPKANSQVIATRETEFRNSQSLCR